MNGETPPVGAAVVDCDATEPRSTAIVLDVPDETATTTVVDETGETIAELNPDYPSDAPVVVVAFQDELEEHMDWTSLPDDELLDEAETAGVRTYTYPVPRLHPADCGVVR